MIHLPAREPQSEPVQLNDNTLSCNHLAGQVFAFA